MFEAVRPPTPSTLALATDPTDPQTDAIVAAARAVASSLGLGGTAGVYQAALAVEFTACGIRYHRDAVLPYSYRGRPLGFSRQVSFVCFDDLIVEVEAEAGVDPVEMRHAMNGAGYEQAILLSFGRHSLEARRVLLRAPLTEDE